MAEKYELYPTYGKQSVPVFKIRKLGRKHEVVDLIVRIMLEGTVSESWLSGENHQIVPTETQKNTCYALALQSEFDCPEDYALALGRDMLKRHSHIELVRIDVEERVWERIVVDGQEHTHAFQSPVGPRRNTCAAVMSRTRETVTSGVRDLKLMKTTNSGFKGYIEDQYTNLEPVGAGGASPDRIMCTELEATWTYGDTPPEGYRRTNERVLKTLMKQFAGPPVEGKFSKSLQETTHQMATAVLDEQQSIQEVWMAAPNVHFYRYPLEQFGLKNENVVFQSTECASTASGRIVTRLVRPRARL